jgi:hypothetical protein
MDQTPANRFSTGVLAQRLPDGIGQLMSWNFTAVHMEESTSEVHSPQAIVNRLADRAFPT